VWATSPGYPKANWMTERAPERKQPDMPARQL